MVRPSPRTPIAIEKKKKKPEAWSLKPSSLLEAKGASKHANDLLWQKRKLQGSKPWVFLILWVKNLGLSALNWLTTHTKNPRFQAPWFLYFSRWNARLSTLHTCNKIEKKTRVVPCAFFASRGEKHNRASYTPIAIFKKKPRAQSPSFLCFLRWKWGQVLRTFQQYWKKTLGRLALGLIHFLKQKAWLKRTRPLLQWRRELWVSKPQGFLISWITTWGWEP